VGKDLFDDLEEDHLSAAIAGLGKALVVVHSPADAVVGIEHGERIFAAAKHPKSFVALDGAHHLLWDERDARWIGELLGAWAGRYVEVAASAASAAAGPSAGAESAAAAAPAGGPEGQVIVTGGPRGYAQEIVAGKHVLRADEPAEFGGTDTGPSPYGLLLAALGSCTSMTLRMVADRKQWPLAGVRVALDHSKIHAKDCADCETKEGRIDRIDRRIRLEGDLDEEQRARLLEIADKCPVHRTLEGEIEIRSALE
jgi:putative redox protein